MIDFISQHAGMIGLLFFFSAFIGIISWAFMPGTKETIESYKYIPLKEESNDLR